MNVLRASLQFFLAYILVTILATSSTIVYEMIFHTPTHEELGVSMVEAPSFLATAPIHIVIMLIVWPVFTWIYAKKRNADFKEYLKLGLFWLALAIIVDYVGFVLIKNPLSLTPHEFYVLYQPWISLIYVAIFISPMIYFAIRKMTLRS